MPGTTGQMGMGLWYRIRRNISLRSTESVFYNFYSYENGILMLFVLSRPFTPMFLSTRWRSMGLQS